MPVLREAVLRYLNAFQKERKLFICLFFCKSKHLKHLLLNVILVDSDTSSADLITVQSDVVSFCAHSARIAVQIL